jgi:D-alanyl-D-alanine carboxypeptidase
MRNQILFTVILFLIPIQYLQALDNTKSMKAFDEKANAVLSAHYKAYKDKEYFSGIELSVYTPKMPTRNYYIGQTGHDSDSKKIDATTLFEIGSITKSFTAAIVLQREKENKLHLTDTIPQWLPEYDKWSAPTVQTLLNMTSGLPNYSDAPLMNAASFAHPEHKYSGKELIEFVYPPASFAPPLKPGYFYTNTGYVLTGLMIEKATRNSFQTEIQERLIKAAGLENTFYPVPDLDKQVYERMAQGYGFNPYSNPELVGKDIKADDLSWAGAAGAVISNSNDIIKWVKALFIENTILDAQQKQKLTQLISTTTGKPIEKTSETDPRAFGLGVSEGYDKEFGRFWFYEGQTEGFRALYIYSVSTGVIISVIFNSSANGENDHASELVKNIFRLIR